MKLDDLINGLMAITPQNEYIKEAIKRLEKEDSALQNSYGEHGLVKMSGEEYQKLIQKYGSVLTEKYITKVDSWAKSEGKKKKSWYATINNWILRDTEAGKIKPVNQSYNLSEIENIMKRTPVYK